MTGGVDVVVDPLLGELDEAGEYVQLDGGVEGAVEMDHPLGGDMGDGGVERDGAVHVDERAGGLAGEQTERCHGAHR